MGAKFFDAFSGVGGFRLGFEAEGFECVGWSEIDKFASKLYRHYFNDDRNFGDITKIDPEELPDFDVITAGVPCQPFSIAGKRKGLADPRGMPLWRALFRIIKHKKPRVVVIENVKGLLSSNGGRDFAWVLVQMAELGYDVEWMVLNSKDFGVPQNRERVYIVGYTGGDGRPKVFPLREDEKAYYQPPAGKRKVQAVPDTSNTLRARYYKIGNEEPYVVQWRRSYVRTFKDPHTSPTLTANMGTGGLNMPILVYLSHTVGNMKQRVQARDTAWTLDTSGTKFGILDPHTLEIRKITPLEAFRLQGFPDDIVREARKIGISDTQLYKMAGNAVTVQVVQSIARKIKSVFFANYGADLLPAVNGEASSPQRRG